MTGSLLNKIVVLAVGTTAVTFVALAGGCSSDSGTNNDAGNNDTGTGMDAPADTKPPKDTAPPDNQPMCPTPGDVSKFMPPALVPNHAASNACDSTAIQGYWTACRDTNATTTTCTTWKNANTACDACIESKRTDSSWGPLVMANGITFINVSGCLAWLGDAACAKADQDAALCEALACDVMCPVTDFFDPDHANTLAQWQKCSQAADASGCKSYQGVVAQTCVNDAGSAYAICTAAFNGGSQTAFKDAYFQYAAMFCSGGG